MIRSPGLVKQTDKRTNSAVVEVPVSRMPFHVKKVLEEMSTDAAVVAQLVDVLDEVEGSCGKSDSSAPAVRVVLGDLNGTTRQGADALRSAGFSSAYAAANEMAMLPVAGSSPPGGLRNASLRNVDIA